MSTISARFAIAAGWGGDSTGGSAADVADDLNFAVEYVEVVWAVEACRITAAAVVVDPSSNLTWAGSFRCEECHASAE